MKTQKRWTETELRRFKVWIEFSDGSDTAFVVDAEDGESAERQVLDTFSGTVRDGVIAYTAREVE